MKRESLTKYTQFRLGGMARIVSVRDTGSLISVLQDLRRSKKNFFILGGGTNIIAQDKGYSGVVVRVRTRDIKKHKHTIVCDAGVALARLVSYANKNGLKGVETLAGIPGTVGGAVFGNAGAYGDEIAHAVKKIYIFDGKKARVIRNTKSTFGYRDSVFKRKPWVILTIIFSFRKEKPATLKKISKDIIALRLKKYKLGLRCAGSIFKNIPVKSALGRKIKSKIPPDMIKGGKIPAGYVLESVGAKGARIGGISVARHHGNLIVNNGKGKSYEAKKLIDMLKKRVHKKYSVWLEEEVRYLGF